jgi:hypothetical protein
VSRKIKIYIEGGGDQAKLKRACRRAFSKFFERAGFAGRMPGVVACGSRNKAFNDFCTAVATANDGVLPLLLVDSEGPVDSLYQQAGNFKPWDHLKRRDDWFRPAAMPRCLFLKGNRRIMSDKKNVLVLSAGRRVELVENFQKALKKQFPGALVYTTDMRPGLSAASQVADKWFKAPRVTSVNYIGLIVPTIDTKLLLLNGKVSNSWQLI